MTAVMKLLVGGWLLHSYSLTQIAWPGHIRRVSFCPAIGWNGPAVATRCVLRSLPYNDGHASAACSKPYFEAGSMTPASANEGSAKK